MTTDVKKIAVIGGGTMGSGIALTAATHGLEAMLVDIDQQQLDNAQAYHRKTLDRNVEKQRMTRDDADSAGQRISYLTNMKDAGDADWVIEAASEDAVLKKKLFWQMLEHFKSSAVLSSNTSSISITDIAAEVDEEAHRVIGMHFFNPVPVMKLVEVVRGLQTSDKTVERTIALAEALGKTPVPANDRAGFVSNRVLMPMINEAFYAWMEGVAEPEHIDQIMTLGMAHPMGPLRLADLIGLDVCHDIMMVLYNELGWDKYFPCPQLRQLVKAGRLGNKTGHGVYKYD